MRKEKYYSIKATYLYPNGTEDTTMYGMNRKEFDVFYEKLMKPKGVKVLNIEEVKIPMKYYS